jgi:hypothetical protein
MMARRAYPNAAPARKIISANIPGDSISDPYDYLRINRWTAKSPTLKNKVNVDGL